MGLFGLDSTRTSNSINLTDSRDTATDEARILRGRNNTSAQNSTLIGRGTNLGTSIKGSKVNYGVQTPVNVKGKNNTTNITFGDGGAAAAAVADTLKSVTDIAGANNEALQSALADQSTTVQGALDKISELTANTQTGGGTAAGKLTLWLVLGGLGLLGLIFYLMRK